MPPQSPFARLLLLGLAAVCCLLMGCPPETEPEPPVDPPPVQPPSYCEELDLPERSFDDQGETGVGRYALAADFTVPTNNGDWNLRANWTGCDIYMFVPEFDDSTGGWPVGPWERDLDELLARSPRNVHWFFFTDYLSPAGRVAYVESQVEDALDAMSEEDRLWWSDHVHFIPERMSLLEDWLKEHWWQTGFGFGIDRFQQLRDTGSLADQDRYDSDRQWFAPNIANTANEPRYYNFEAEREAELASRADGVTEVTVFAESFNGNGYADVELPSAEVMAGFDTLEYDLFLGCGGDREYGSCGAWDYLVELYNCAVPVEEGNPYADESCQSLVPGVAEVLEELGTCSADGEPTEDTCIGVLDCEDDSGVIWTCDGYVAPVAGVDEIPADTYACSCTEPNGTVTESAYTCNGEGTGYNDCSCSCGTEIGRWITTYHREGRWVHDASPMLAYLKEGGTQRFRFRTQQVYDVQLKLRLSDSGREGTPQELIPLFNGGRFGSDYNEGREPVDVMIPEGATRVELAAVISGHGYGQNAANCAEFCPHSHHFYFHDEEVVFDNPWADVQDGCEQQVSDGAVPNQFGTWFFGRGGWCPGMEVAPRVEDITDRVVPGETLSVSYEGRLRGQPYTEQSANNGGFNASIKMDSWLVVSYDSP